MWKAYGRRRRRTDGRTARYDNSSLQPSAQVSSSRDRQGEQFIDVWAKWGLTTMSRSTHAYALLIYRRSPTWLIFPVVRALLRIFSIIVPFPTVIDNNPTSYHARKIYLIIMAVILANYMISNIRITYFRTYSTNIHNNKFNFTVCLDSPAKFTVPLFWPACVCASLYMY